MGAYLIRRLVTLPLLFAGHLGHQFLRCLTWPRETRPKIVLRQRNPGQLPSPAAVAAMRSELGLDAPLPVQYARWVARAGSGDLGRFICQRTAHSGPAGAPHCPDRTADRSRPGSGAPGSRTGGAYFRPGGAAARLTPSRAWPRWLARRFPRMPWLTG